jgi:hypothetical protein
MSSDEDSTRGRDGCTAIDLQRGEGRGGEGREGEGRRGEGNERRREEQKEKNEE